jgi:predicted nucleotidyltransferase
MQDMSPFQSQGIQFDRSRFEELLKRYQVKELSLFGSILGQGFSPQSDIDFLVIFEDQDKLSLFDLMDLESELASIFGRPIDLIEPDGLTNSIRRQNILSHHKVIYAQ